MLGSADAAAPFQLGLKEVVDIVAQRGNGAHSGYDDASSHGVSLACGCGLHRSPDYLRTMAKQLTQNTRHEGARNFLACRWRLRLADARPRAAKRNHQGDSVLVYSPQRRHTTAAH